MRKVEILPTRDSEAGYGPAIALHLEEQKKKTLMEITTKRKILIRTIS